MSEEMLSKLDLVPDDVLLHLMARTAWQRDPDTGQYEGTRSFVQGYGSREDSELDRDKLQKACWDKFQTNPHVNTSTRGVVGRLTGWGFETSSSIPEIQEVIRETENDYRNRLYNYYPKYAGRAQVEGELFLCFTVHDDGFVEIDFIDPETIAEGKADGGIIFHPTKTLMPLIYIIQPDQANGYSSEYTQEIQIPSIFLARNPDLLSVARQHQDFNEQYLQGSRTKSRKFKKLGGFNRFIIAWDKSFCQRRNVGYLRTVIEWLEHYENLKKYEIDHKKSSGAFVWGIEFDDIKAFRLFMSLSDEEMRKTGLGAKMTPGSKIFLPPGVHLKAVNPQLPKISDSDTDILHMVTSGLNEPEDVMTGSSKGTFASVKASRAPMSDRVSDEVAYFERFLRYDFWGSIFFLKAQVSDFPESFSVSEAVDFKNKKPVIKKLKKAPEELLEITFPTSETNDAEGAARAWLGVKHGSTNDTLGISNKTIARKMGVQNYNKERLRAETEKERYPELIPTLDAESVQERTQAEPPLPGVRKKPGTPTTPKTPAEPKPQPKPATPKGE